MFRNIRELVAQAEEKGLRISDIMLLNEMETSGRAKDEILDEMMRSWQVMKQAAEKGIQGVTSYSGMTGMDAKRLDEYIAKGNTLTDITFLRAVNYAIATNEVNASMGIICATPTAGSCGVLPGVLLSLQKRLRKSDIDIVFALLTAGAIGYVVANNAFVSGAAGGCQAEIGSASAMAAAAAVELAGGTPRQAAHAMAIAMKNMLGLTCDPLAGLVEVPCIKRNAAGAANALTAAEMALAGIESHIPWDEVISAMYQIGLAMPLNVRETALGGLAATETGKQWKKKLWNNGQKEFAG